MCKSNLNYIVIPESKEIIKDNNSGTNMMNLLLAIGEVIID